MKEIINTKDREKMIIMGNLDIRTKDVEQLKDENNRLKNLISTQNAIGSSINTMNQNWQQINEIQNMAQMSNKDAIAQMSSGPGSGQIDAS